MTQEEFEDRLLEALRKVYMKSKSDHLDVVIRDLIATLRDLQHKDDE